MTITLMIGSIRSSIISYRGSRSRSDPIRNLNVKGDTVGILAMRHFLSPNFQTQELVRVCPIYLEIGELRVPYGQGTLSTAKELVDPLNDARKIRQVSHT